MSNVPRIKSLGITKPRTGNWFTDNSESGSSTCVVERRRLRKLTHGLIADINRQKEEEFERSGAKTAIEALNAQLRKRAPEVLFAPRESYKSGLTPSFKPVLDEGGNILFYNLEHAGDLVARVSTGGDGAVPSTEDLELTVNYQCIGGDYDGHTFDPRKKSKVKKPKPISANTLALINRAINPHFGAST